MISILGQGFLLGLAYAMPIGAQNLFVINSASKGNASQALKTALIFAAMDVSLGVACILGVGSVIQGHDLARLVIGSIGSGFLIYIGYNLIKKKTNTATSAAPSAVGSLWKAAFLLTWCNPHALLDGSILLGGYQSALSQTDIYVFSVGLALASSTWFISLSTLVNRFQGAMTVGRLSFVNRLCGLAMILFGLKLAASLVGGGL